MQINIVGKSVFLLACVNFNIDEVNYLWPFYNGYLFDLWKCAETTGRKAD